MAPFPDLRVLREFYGLLPQPPTDLFQFFLWEILSADALPARRDLVWHALRQLPALTPDAVFRTKAKTLLETVALIGPHRDDRVARIRALTGEIKRHRDALDADALRVSGFKRAVRQLSRLSKIDRETRDRALLYVAGFCLLPLDDGSARVVARINGAAIPISEGAEGFTLKRAQWSGKLRRQRRRARHVLASELPKDIAVYRDAVLYLRHHAQNTCIAVSPHCGICPLRPQCVFGLQRTSEHQ